MATLTEVFTNIANSIRNRLGTTAKIKPANFSSNINNIFERLVINTYPVTANTLVQIRNDNTGSIVESGYTNSNGVYTMVGKYFSEPYTATATVNGKHAEIRCSDEYNTMNPRCFWLNGNPAYCIKTKYMPSSNAIFGALYSSSSNGVVYAFNNKTNTTSRFTNGLTETTVSNSIMPQLTAGSTANQYLVMFGQYNAYSNVVRAINLSGTISNCNNMYASLNYIGGGVCGNSSYAVVAGGLEGGYIQNDIQVYQFSNLTYQKLSSEISGNKVHGVRSPKGIFLMNYKYWNSDIKSNMPGRNVDFLNTSLTMQNTIFYMHLSIDYANGVYLNGRTLLHVSRGWEFDVYTGYNDEKWSSMSIIIMLDSSLTKSYIGISDWGKKKGIIGGNSNGALVFDDVNINRITPSFTWEGLVAVNGWFEPEMPAKMASGYSTTFYDTQNRWYIIKS